MLVIAGGGLVFTQLKTQFFPKDLQYFSYLDVWLVEDSPLSATKETVQQVESIVEKVSGKYGRDNSGHGKPKEVLQSMTAFIGGGPRFWSSATPEDKQTNYVQIILRTSDKDDTTDLLALLQPEFDKEVPSVIVDARTPETGEPIGSYSDAITRPLVPAAQSLYCFFQLRLPAWRRRFAPEYLANCSEHSSYGASEQAGIYSNSVQ